MFNPFREKKSGRVGKRGEELPEAYEGLPDSYRPNGLCPRCNKQSSFDVKGSLPVTYDSSCFALGNDKYEQMLIDRASSLICRNCKQGVVVVEEEWVGDYPKKQAKQGGTVSYRGIHWWPIPEANLSSDIPSEIAAVVAEAASAIYANCPRACVFWLIRPQGHIMNPQRRFAPIGGLFKPESVAGLARIRN